MNNYPDGVSTSDIDKHFGSEQPKTYRDYKITYILNGKQITEIIPCRDGNDLANEIRSINAKGGAFRKAARVPDNDQT